MSIVGETLIGAAIGCLATAAAAMPIYNSKLSKLQEALNGMEKSCVTCKAGVERSIETLAKTVATHHEDDEKHTSKASATILTDILNRVMRIESRLFNGNRQG